MGKEQKRKRGTSEQATATVSAKRGGCPDGCEGGGEKRWDWKYILKTELRGFTYRLDGVGVRKKDKSKVPPASGLSTWTVEFPCVELEKTVCGGSFCVFLCQSLGGLGPALFVFLSCHWEAWIGTLGERGMWKKRVNVMIHTC